MIVSSSGPSPENSNQGRELIRRIEQAQELGRVCFLNTESGVCLRVSFQQNAQAALRAALGHESRIEEITVSDQPSLTAQIYTSASHINGEGGLRGEVIADFYRNHPLDTFSSFEEFREQVYATLGYIDVSEWYDLIEAVPRPIPTGVQHGLLVPMLEMGELGDVCGVVEVCLASSGWSLEQIAKAYRPEVREMRAARFRFQELTDFNLLTIQSGEQLNEALATLDRDRFDINERNEYSATDKSEALRCYIIGQPLKDVDINTISLTMVDFWRLVGPGDLALIRADLQRREWSSLYFPRFVTEDPE